MDEIVLLLFFATGILIVAVIKLKSKLNQLKVRFLGVRRQISGVRKEAITAKKTAANLLKLLDDETLEKRLDMFKRQKEKLNAQMAQLKQYQQKIDYKIAYYTEAVKKGTINAAESSACLKAEKERIFGKTLREAG